MSSKLGIIGLGSIGLRHAEVLAKRGDVELFAFRTNKGVKEVSPQLAEVIRPIYDWDEFEALALDGYIVSNPTALHEKTLRSIGKKKKPIFVEKPIFGNYEAFHRIESLDSSLIQVGFCLRYHNLIKKVREIIKNGELGNIYHCRLNVGQYLPNWHPYTDYSQEYYAQSDLGGGALRTLSHEIDLALYFLGVPTTHKTHTSKVSGLNIDVDDYAMVLMQYGERSIARIEMDFLSRTLERSGRFYGEKGDLSYNLAHNTIDLNKGEQERILVDTNDMYTDQMNAYMDFVTTGVRDDVSSSYEDNLTIEKIMHDEQPF